MEQARRRLQDGPTVVPTQTYYIPIPEKKMMDSFNGIRQTTSGTGHISSLASIAASATGTIIWYDHWEDGYEKDVTKPEQSSTEIYGDQNPDNGCVRVIKEHMAGSWDFTKADCSAADDLISSGDALLFKNEGLNADGTSSGTLSVQNAGYIETNNRAFTAQSDPPSIPIVFDGGDLVRASFPVAMSRGAHPRSGGSLLAGAVEIVEAENYGVSFTAPVGTNTPDPSSRQHFELSELHFMATTDGTDVWDENENKLTTQGPLAQGDTYVAKDVQQGKKFTTNKPVQVDLLTGDEGTTYEMRW